MGSSPDTSGGGSHGHTHSGSPAFAHHGASPPPCFGASASPSTLSPAAEPFFPSVSSEDRGMAKRWMDFSDDSDSDDDINEVIDTGEVAAASKSPYLDAVRSSPAPVPMPTLRSIVVQPPRGEGGHRKRPRRRGRRPPPPPPQGAKCRSRRSNRQRGKSETVVGLRRYEHPHKDGRAALGCGPASSPPSYCDVVRCPPPPAPATGSNNRGLTASAGTDVDAAALTVMVGSAAAPAGGRRKRTRPSRRVRKRHPPPPVTVAPREPPRRSLAERLGPVPAAPSTVDGRADVDGFQVYISRSTRRRLRREDGKAMAVPPSPTARRFPPELYGRCFNCLSFTHRVATCKLPRRCLRCHGFRHLAKNCDRARSPPVARVAQRRTQASRGVETAPQPLQRFVRANGLRVSPASGAPRRGAVGTNGISPALARWVAPKVVATTSTGVHPGSSCCARQAAAFETSCFRDEWSPSDHELDPMCLEATIAGLSQSCGREMVHHQAKDSEAGEEAEPVELSTTVSPHRPRPSEDTESTPPATDVLDPPAMLPVDGPSLGHPVEGPMEESVLVTPAKAAAPVADSEDLDRSPPGFSRAMARDEETDESRLSAFVKAVQCKIQTPLMPMPVKTKRVVPVLAELPKRSERLANHPLASVASSKRAEVLLMQRLEGAPQTALATTKAKQAYKKFYAEEEREKNLEAIRDLLPSLRCASLFG